MAGGPEGDALRRDTSPGRTGSRAVSSSTNQPQETPQRGRPIPQQNPSAVPAHESKEEQNATGSMAVPPSKNTKGPKAFSWAEVVAGAKPVKESSTIDPSRGKTPSRATNPTPMRHPPSGRVVPSGPAQADETREQDTTSMPPSRNPNVSEREVSGPRYKITSLPQTDSSKTEADIRTEHAAEKGRLQEMKSYLRELTEAHDLPRALMEHLSDEESETTPETIDALFKDFASRLSKEYRGKEENLQSAQAKLEMSTSAQATLEKEKLALEEVTKMKDAKLEELKSAAQQTGESNVEDLKAQIKDCAIERDEAISELGELRKKLEAAESERNEKEISLQKLNIALEEARQSDRQADPSVDVDALRITISDLRKELRDLKSDKADLERQYERDTDALRQKDNDRAADMIRQDEFFIKLHEENAKYRKRIEALQRQKEQLQKTSEAEAKREPVTFRVDNKILSRDKYEKLLDNMRGDMAKLEEQLQKAEEERERAIRDVDGIRQMVMEEIVPRYALAVDEAAQNMFNTWAEEDARLMALAGEGGYHRYLHAIVEPDNQISQISSEAFDVRGETAAGLGLDGSESSEPTSPPVRQNLETELGEFSRESSIFIEDTLIGHGDGSAELVKALDECQIHLKKADQRVEELESETKKQKDELEALQDEIQKLKEAAEVAKLDADGSAELQKALGESQIRCKEANQKIKELKDKTKKQEEETEELQAEIQKLKAAAETSREGSVKLHGMLDECQRQRNEAGQIIKELKGETKKQEDEIKELKDEMQKLKEAAATAGTSRGSGEEPGASECGDQTPKQAVTEHEDAAKRDGQGLQGASAGELRDMQANLNECQAHRKQADREIERLKGEARRRSRELRKLKDNQSLQQRLDELHKDQIGVVQAEASKAKARVRWAETRVALQAKGAGDEEAIFSSAKDSEDYLKLISTLSQRVEESESQYGRAHQELADVRTKATILRATIEQLDSQRNQLEQDRQQLYEKLRARRHSEQDVGQANAALEEELKNEELREMDGDIEETNEVIRKTKEELAKMDKELQELSKALDDCRAHDKTLMEELAALNERRDGESEGDNSQDDDPQKEIDRLEDEVADLQRQLSKAKFNASNEAARRREVEDHGVWEGTRAAALKSKQTELDNMKKENEELLTDLDDLKKKYKKSQTELDNLKKEFEFAVESYEGELELGVISDNKRIEADKAERERIKLHYRHIVGELEARLRKAEEESRGHASEIARVKSEHRVPIDEVEAQRGAGRMRFPFPPSESLERKGPEPMGTIRLPRHAKTGGWPYEVGSHGPLWEYLVAYFALKESIKPLDLEDTALRDYLLRIVDKLDQEVARRIALSRSPMASETRAPSRPKTPGSPRNDSARSSSPGDQVPNSPNDEDGEDGEDKEDENEENEEDEEDEEDKEDERTATLRGIKETCKALEELRPRKQRFLDKEASAVQLIVAFEAEIEALRKRVDGADDSDEMTAQPEGGSEEASDDESDNDKTDPAAIRRRIARLRKKVNRTKTNLAKDEKALRSAIEEHEADLAEWINDLDTLGNDPEGTLYRYLANGAWLTAQAARWKGSTYERPIPLPSFEVIEAMAKRPPNGQKQNLGVDALIDNGDLDNPPRHQKPQEALVRLIQEKLASLRSYTDGCKQDLDRITGVMVASEPTSVASGDLTGDNGNPNRILKSGIPETVLDALSQWKATVDKILDKMEMLQGAVEGLIDAGVSLGDYECLRVRVRRLRKDLANAAAANADLRAKLSEGSVEGTNSELQEMIKTLKHENDSLREQSQAADQAIKDRAAQEERQRQLEKELIAARARTEVEEIENKTLAEDKEQLEKAVERMEKCKDEAIRDGLDREIHETLYNYEELKKEAAELREKLSNQFLTKSAPLDAAHIAIEAMTSRLKEADKRAAVAEDLYATLAKDVEGALDVDAEDDTKSLERLRRVLSDILCRVPGKTDGQSGESAEDEHERVTDEYGPNTEREHELIRKMAVERRKRVEDMAAAKKAHEERTSRLQAEHEQQVKGWKAMHDATEKARKLSETKLIEALKRIRFLAVEVSCLRQINGELDERLKEECTANQDMSEELYGSKYAGGKDGAGDGPKIKDSWADQVSRKLRQSRRPKEQPGAAAAGGDPDDDDDHHNTSDGEGSDGSDGNIRSGRRCTCPCVGLCGAPVNPVFDSLPAGAQNIVRNLSRVYTQYRSCCGKSGPGASATAAAAAGGKEEEDDGLLLWRLLGVMRGDSDIREQMQNEGRHYATRLLLAFRGCAWVHFLSWRQTAWWWVGGLWYYATFFLPAVGRRKPGLALVPPPPPPPPKRVAIVVKDMLLLGLLYYTYRVLAATWAVQRVWEMANGYTRAYFVERALHPERSTWLGLGGVDMRLPGFASEPGTAPFSAAVGDGVMGWLGRSWGAS